MRDNIHQNNGLWPLGDWKENVYSNEGPKDPYPVYNYQSGHKQNNLQFSTYTISDKEFNKLSKYIKENYGINLKEEKKTLMIGRLRNVLLQNNFKNFSEYYDYIISDKTGVAAATLIDRISTNHTFFMREADHFKYFQDTVLPYLKKAMERSKDLRIWSAGCSSGEEPYTLAMIIDEFFGAEKAQWDTKILATDISNKVLDTAKRGIYDNEKIANIPSNWKLKYFKQVNGNCSRIIDRIRNEVIFRRLNLMDEKFPFRRKFNVIFCRNVMIYFDSQTKKKLVEKFYDLMEYGGYLFIGHSESISRGETRFKYIRPAVYRKE